jgi:hypothetical protein
VDTYGNGHNTLIHPCFSTPEARSLRKALAKARRNSISLVVFGCRLSSFGHALPWNLMNLYLAQNDIVQYFWAASSSENLDSFVNFIQ